MKLLLINQHYPPDPGATGRLTAQLAEKLARGGHEVTVLTGRPTYEEAKGMPAPREEAREGVRVIRLPLLARRSGPIGRALHYLSFAISLVVGGLRVPRPHAVLAYSSTPLFGGVAALLFARLKRCPLVYGVNDVYPEMAIALGVLREGPLA
ncbi:MAG: glycosyltransferase, partial [bacterium]